MHIELSLFSFLELLTFSASFMLGILFFTIPSANKKANFFLSLLLLVISFEIANSFLNITKVNNLWQIFFEIFIVFGFTPLLFFYTFQTVNKSFKKVLWMLIGPAFLLSILIHFCLLPKVVSFFIEILLYLFEIILLIFILQEIHFTKTKLKSFYSQLENKKINWIKTLVFFSLTYLIVDFVQDFLLIEAEYAYLFFNKMTIVFDFILVYWIAYHGFTQSEIFRDHLFKDSSPQNNEHLKLIANQSKFKLLENQISINKFYLDKDLNLRSLSSHLDINEKELSMLINKYSKTNFYHFVNKFRIAEFKRLSQTAKADQFSIFGLAQEAGFSSKSTFYNAFKTLEDKTPRQYQLSLK